MNNHFEGEFKVGMVLRVRTFADIKNNYPPLEWREGYRTSPYVFVESMYKLCGNFVTVRCVIDNNTVKLEEDPMCCYWAKEMFTPLVSKLGNIMD